MHSASPNDLNKIDVTSALFLPMLYQGITKATIVLTMVAQSTKLAPWSYLDSVITMPSKPPPPPLFVVSAASNNVCGVPSSKVLANMVLSDMG